MRSKLRTFAAVVAAGLFALGLSVGASLAEGDSHEPRAAHFTPAGVCLLPRD